MRIKKFEAFKHRIPKESTSSEYQKYMDDYQPELFNKKEVVFFEKIYEENKGCFYEKPLVRTINLDEFYYTMKNQLLFESITLELYSINRDEIQTITISKKEDEWYLIKENNGWEDYTPSSQKFYICDGWDEVLGYLGTQTSLKF